MKIINEISMEIYWWLWKKTENVYFEIKFINAVIKQVRKENKKSYKKINREILGRKSYK